jgi:hypothetical protein
MGWPWYVKLWHIIFAFYEFKIVIYNDVVSGGVYTFYIRISYNVAWLTPKIPCTFYISDKSMQFLIYLVKPFYPKNKNVNLSMQFLT